MANFEQLAIGGLDYYSETEPSSGKEKELWLKYDATTETVYDGTKGTGLTENWSSTAYSKSTTYGLSIFDNTVYTQRSDSELVGFDFDTGNEVYLSSQFLNGTGINDIEIENGIMYVVDDNGGYAYDISDKSLIWSNSLFGSYNCVTVLNDVVAVGGHDFYPGKLYAVDKSDGSELWSKDYGDHNYVNVAESVENNIFIGVDDGTIARYGADGTEVWSHTRHSGDSVQSMDIDGSNISYAASLTVYTDDISDGSEKWNYYFSGSIRSISVSNGVTYVGGAESNIEALDLTDGTNLWTTSIDSNDNNLYTVTEQDATISVVAGHNAENYDIDGITDSDITEETVATTSVNSHVYYNDTWVPHQ